MYVVCMEIFYLTHSIDVIISYVVFLSIVRVSKTIYHLMLEGVAMRERYG